MIVISAEGGSPSVVPAYSGRRPAGQPGVEAGGIALLVAVGEKVMLDRLLEASFGVIDGNRYLSMRQLAVNLI
jgi:hypothetical protein